MKSWIKALDQHTIRFGEVSNYNTVDMIGEGGQARVYKLIKSKQLDSKGSQKHGKGKFYALKVIKKTYLSTEAKVQQLRNEIKVQRELHCCESTVSILRVYENKSSVKLLMPYYSGGSLGDMIRENIRFSELEIKMIVAQLLLVVDFMER